MRTFISLKLSNEIIKEVKRIQKELEDSGLFVGKLTEEENLHLTLKFLGEIGEKKLEEIKKRLRTINLKKFKAKLGELGVFSESFVRIIWVKLEGIEGLQSQVDNSLYRLFTPEKRFMGHITIARVKKVKDKAKFLEFLSEIKVKEVEFKVESFELMNSELKSYGSEYDVIDEYGLV